MPPLPPPFQPPTFGAPAFSDPSFFNQPPPTPPPTQPAHPAAQPGAGAGTYGFGDAKDRVEAGGRYDVRPADARPPKPPRAEPVDENWYVRMKDLQDTQDRRRKVGLKLAEAEEEELKKLRERLQSWANRGYERPKGAEAGWSGMPTGKPLWEKWTPAGAMEDLKGFLPAGIGNKLGDITKGFKAGSAAAEVEGGSALIGGVRGAVAGAGPAVALAAVSFASNQAAKAFEGFDRSIGRAGDVVSQIADNDHFGALMTVADGVKESLAGIPIIGREVAARFGAMVAPVRAFQQVTESFVHRVRELDGLAGRLTAANANADARKLVADIDEARRLDKSYAGIVNAQSRIETSAQRIGTDIKAVLAPPVERLLERMAAHLERFEAMFTKHLELMEFVYQMPGGLKDAQKGIELVEDAVNSGIRVSLEMLGLAKKKDMEDTADRLLKEFKGLTDDLKPTPQAPGQVKNGQAGRINAPIFNMFG